MNPRHRALILSLALALRVLVALARTDRHWHDEHYQTIEPAYFLVHGHGVLTWEWLHGFRSWMLPLAHVPLVALGALIGAPSGLPLTLLVRAVYAIADGLVLARFVEFAIERQPFDDDRDRATARALALTTVLLLPTVALWSASSLQDHLASLLFYAVIPSVFRAIETDRPARWALAGALLAIPVTVKLQCAPLCAGVALTALLKQRTHIHIGRSAVAITLGALSVALVSATIDALTLGSFGASTARQLLHGEALSRSYGTSPPWAYVTALPSLIGWDGVALALALLAPTLRPRARTPSPSALAPVALIAPGAVALAVILSAIGHKEPRFLLPIVPVALVSLFNARSIPALSRLPSRLALPALVALALWSLSSVTTQRIELSDSDVSRLEERVRARRTRADQRISLCLFGVHWSQLRGSVGVGGAVRYLDALAFDQPEHALAQCQFAIVRATQETRFAAASRAMSARWISDAPRQNHCALYVRERE